MLPIPLPHQNNILQELLLMTRYKDIDSHSSENKTEKAPVEEAEEAPAEEEEQKNE